MGLSAKMVAQLYHQYEVIGRHVPTERDPEPKAYRIKLFTRNETQARSRFWYFIRRLVKMKKANAEILSLREIFEKKPEKVREPSHDDDDDGRARARTRTQMVRRQGGVCAALCALYA